MTPDSSYDVFISHNRLDKPWVREFVQCLRVGGLRVFFDEDTMEYGEDVVTGIDAAIERSKHVLFIISRNSIASKWVALETSISIYADPSARIKKIIPILIEAVPDEQIKTSIRRLNRVDLTNVEHRDEALRRLLRQLGIADDRIVLPRWPGGNTNEPTPKASQSIYRFCQPAEEWYVPRREEEMVRSLLADTSGKPHKNVVITGRTGFGKSSFLRWLSREAVERDRLVMQIKPTSDRLSEFYESIKQHSLDLIDTLDIGVPKLKGVYPLDIDGILNRLTDKTGKRLVILIDQFENLLPLASSAAASAIWRSITDTIGNPLRNPQIVWIFAVKESYFLALFPNEISLRLIDSTYITLSDLDHDQATALVKRLAFLMNVTIEDRAIDLLVTRTGGRPLALVLSFLVAFERSPTALLLEYDYLAESEPWNEIFRADYQRLESRRQRLIVLALANSGREVISQDEIVGKVAQADGCSLSDVEADLKRIENEVGLIVIKDGVVSFVHSGFGLYIDRQHRDEYPPSWRNPSSRDQQVQDVEVLSADIVQRVTSTLLHNFGTRLGAGPIYVDDLRLALREGDLNKAAKVTDRLNEWLEQLFDVLKRTRSAFDSYQVGETAANLVEAIWTAAKGLPRDIVHFELSGVEPVGQSRVTGRQDVIEAVFSELFHNSVDANVKTIFVHLEKDPESQLIVCHVRDDGSGIPEPYRDEIFNLFFSTRPAATGIGLAFVKKAVESCGGSISLVRSDKTGTHFLLKFLLFKGDNNVAPQDSSR